MPISRNASRRTRSISVHVVEPPECPSVALTTVSQFPETPYLLELRLMHVFTSSIAKTMTASDPGHEDTWSVTVPSLAFNAPCLMNAIFAISALYLHSLYPNDQTLAYASHKYLETAIAQYKSLLSARPDASNAEALFVTSSLIAFYTTAARILPNDTAIQSKGHPEYTPPVEWFISYQGVKMVVLNSWRWLRDSPRVLPIILSQPALALDLSPDRPSFFDALLQGIDEQLKFMDEKLATEIRNAYTHSVAFLNWAHQRPERNRLMGFAATVSKRFVQMLVEKEPRTMVIVACFFAMTKAADDIWWLQGIAKREVTGLASLLPQEWWPLVGWAIKVSNADKPLDEDVWGHFACSNPSTGRDGLDGDIRAHIDYLVSMMPETGDA